MTAPTTTPEAGNDPGRAAGSAGQRLDVGDLVTEFFSRFGAGDRAALLELFGPEVDFLVQGAQIVPWTGRRSGPSEVSEFLSHVLDDVDTQSFTVERIVVDTPDAVVFGDFAHRIRSTGRIFTGAFALRITADGGRITRYHMFEDSHAAAEAFTPAP